MSKRDVAREKLRQQLNWRSPGGVPQRILTLERDEAEALLVGPLDPTEMLREIAHLALKAEAILGGPATPEQVLAEIGRLALLVTKEEVERIAAALPERAQ